MLRLGAVAESGSEHPLGQAIVKKSKDDGMIISSPETFEAVLGHGLRAEYAGHTIIIGNRKLMQGNKIALTENVDFTINQLEKEGKTAILISIDKKHSGIIKFLPIQLKKMQRKRLTLSNQWVSK